MSNELNHQTAKKEKGNNNKPIAIGATTKISLLSSPLRDRFGMVYHLDFYEDQHLEQILARSSKILGLDLNQESAMEIARRARKTPRIANRLLKRVRDYCEVKNNGQIDTPNCQLALDMLEIDMVGLDAIDRRVLEVIIDKFNGGPVGLGTIAAASGEDLATIEEVYEPYLMRLGFLDRSARGRLVTDLGYRHLGRKRVV